MTVELITPTASEKARWDRGELATTLGVASAHIRFLLHELSQAEEVASGDLKSQRVAYAQVQRICNSRGKESLVVSREANGEKYYALNPTYRDDVRAFVVDAVPPPPSVPKPPGERKPRRPRRGQMSALDGIATLTTTLPGLAPAQSRRISQTSAGRSLPIPAEISLDFCRELMGFLNATGGGGARYRIVLEDDGYRLEAC